MSNELKVFHVDDMTLFAAFTHEQAAELYTEWCGEPLSPEHVVEADDDYLDAEIPEFNDCGGKTGRMTSIRSWLTDAVPGFLASTID